MADKSPPGSSRIWGRHSNVWTLQRLETVAHGHPYIKAKESAEFYLNVRPGGRRPSPVCGLSAVGWPPAESVLLQVASGSTVPRAEGLGLRALRVPYEPHPVPVLAFSDRDFPLLPGEQFGEGQGRREVGPPGRSNRSHRDDDQRYTGSAVEEGKGRVDSVGLVKRRPDHPRPGRRRSAGCAGGGSCRRSSPGCGRGG